MKKIFLLMMIIPIIVMSGSVTKISSFASPDVYPNGLAQDDTNFLFLGGSSDSFYKLDPSNGTVVDSFNLSSIYGSLSVTGMTYDGTYFWVSDQTTDTIYQLELQSTAITSTSIGKIKTLFE